MCGDSDNFQKLIFTVSMLCLFTGMFCIFSLNFLAPDPEFSCL